MVVAAEEEAEEEVEEVEEEVVVVTAVAVVAVAVAVAGGGRAPEGERASERELRLHGVEALARAEIGCMAAQGRGGRGRAAHESERELDGEEYDSDRLEIPPRELPRGTILLGEHIVYHDLRGG